MRTPVWVRRQARPLLLLLLTRVHIRGTARCHWKGICAWHTMGSDNQAFLAFVVWLQRSFDSRGFATWCKQRRHFQNTIWKARRRGIAVNLLKAPPHLALGALHLLIP